MSYKYSQIQAIANLDLLTAAEQQQIKDKWENLCKRETINTSELVFFQKENGRFFKAKRGRINSHPSHGCGGGFWAIKYGNCKRWGFRKNVFCEYDPVQVDQLFSSKKMENGVIITIPATVQSKKEVLELAKNLGFNF